MTAPAHPLLHRILSTKNTPWNDWTSCLVYHHKAVNEMADWMERMHRFEVIMLTHIYPQVAEIARSDTEFEQMINKVEPGIFAMAIADKHDRIRCEKVIIAWDKLSGLVRETLSKQPTREQIDAQICMIRASLVPLLSIMMHDERSIRPSTTSIRYCNSGISLRHSHFASTHISPTGSIATASDPT